MKPEKNLSLLQFGSKLFFTTDHDIVLTCRTANGSNLRLVKTNGIINDYLHGCSLPGSHAAIDELRSRLRQETAFPGATRVSRATDCATRDPCESRLALTNEQTIIRRDNAQW